MDDIRYSELVFLRALATGAQAFNHFCSYMPEQLKTVGLDPNMYVEMSTNTSVRIALTSLPQHHRSMPTGYS